MARCLLKLMMYCIWVLLDLNIRVGLPCVGEASHTSLFQLLSHHPTFSPCPLPCGIGVLAEDEVLVALFE